MTLTTRLAIAMILLVAIAVSAFGWLSYRNLEQALLPRARNRIERRIRGRSRPILNATRPVRSEMSRPFMLRRR